MNFFAKMSDPIAECGCFQLHVTFRHMKYVLFSTKIHKNNFPWPVLTLAFTTRISDWSVNSLQWLSMRIFCRNFLIDNHYKTVYGVCKHCQFVYASSVLSVMSVSGFPLIIMSAHAQCSMCTCSVEGIPSLVCLHMLSVGASLISMQCKHWRRRRIFGEDEEKVKNPSSSPKIHRLHHKKGRLRHKIRRLDWLNTNANRQRWPSPVYGSVRSQCSSSTVFI